MDLTYGPGELDHKITKMPVGSDMKREHDSVDDFEHLDPEISPVEVQKKDISSVGKYDTKHVDMPPVDSSNNKDAFGTMSSGDLGSDSATDFFRSHELNSRKDVLSEFEEKKNDFADFGAPSEDLMGKHSPEKLFDHFEGNDFGNKSFISAEKAEKLDEFENEGNLLDLGAGSSADSLKMKQELPGEFGIEKSGTFSEEEFNFATNNTKSMKEDDALSQYSLKNERKEDIESKEPSQSDFNLDNFNHENLGSQSPPIDLKNYIAICPPKLDDNEPEDELSDHEKEIFEQDTLSSEVVTNTKTAEILKTDSPKENLNTETSIDAVLNKPVDSPTQNSQKSSNKTYVPDLDEIIGPEDVFKRIGLDAWFTPDRLHPTVEALVYWRDPKQSGIVFGSIMAILLSLCYMSLISVVAYSSLLALTGTICFRIYKNILQAVQKTSEGHPFKEYLDLDLSLPQDKVRDTVDTTVVHINAAIVELRRLFLVEDLIDSIKFAVCLWCLTYVGAIFNGMTLVILAFVALFTVPKIYENNKASIDQYIDMGRSKVAEITSKVKAALPVGKKETEKDKEQ